MVIDESPLQLGHGVGKIALPDQLFHKQDNWTADEWEQMKEHALAGERILNHLAQQHSHFNVYQMSAAAARLGDVTLVPTSCQHSAKLTQDCYATTGSVPIRLMTLRVLWLGKRNMFPSRYNPDLRLTESLPPAMSCAASGGGYAE